MKVSEIVSNEKLIFLYCLKILNNSPPNLISLWFFANLSNNHYFFFHNKYLKFNFFPPLDYDPPTNVIVDT